MDAADAVVLAATATKLGPEAAGRVVVSGSHGGAYVAYLVAAAAARAAILNDAGVGRDDAGIAGLGRCAAIGMAAATVGHDSARIGDAEDSMRRGVISHANDLAGSLGCVPGMPCRQAAGRLSRAPLPSERMPAHEETRHLVGETADGRRIICLDSASLVRPDDAGQIVVTGSHAALVGGRPENALRVDALAALFNDAGIGAAGVGRLPALDERGVAAAAVACDSARIGDGQSTYFDGVVSRVNRTAERAGARPGMAARRFVALFGGAKAA